MKWRQAKKLLDRHVGPGELDNVTLCLPLRLPRWTPGVSRVPQRAYDRWRRAAELRMQHGLRRWEFWYEVTAEATVFTTFAEMDGDDPFSSKWRPDPTLNRLGARYHDECEAYDRMVCTGPTGRDGVRPSNAREQALISRNAAAVRERLEAEAGVAGFGREQLRRAIASAWHPWWTP